jgi:hypothetical protein
VAAVMYRGKEYVLCSGDGLLLDIFDPEKLYEAIKSTQKLDFSSDCLLSPSRSVKLGYLTSFFFKVQSGYLFAVGYSHFKLL